MCIYSFTLLHLIESYCTVPSRHDNFDQSIFMNLPPLSGLIIKILKTIFQKLAYIPSFKKKNGVNKQTKKAVKKANICCAANHKEVIKDIEHCDLIHILYSPSNVFNYLLQIL